MLTRKSLKLKHWDKGCKCEYHSKNLQVRDISKKTVPKYKIDILIQKGIFTQRRRFVCDDCLNMYGQSEDSDDIVSNWFYLTFLPVIIWCENHAHAKYQITWSKCIKVPYFLYYASMHRVSNKRHPVISTSTTPQSVTIN